MTDFANDRLWINGKWVSLDMSRLYDFIHDLPNLPAPFDEDLQTLWLSFFNYGEHGGSAWSHDLQVAMLQVKVAAYASAITIIDQATSTETHTVKDAVAAFRSNIQRIDLFMSSVEHSFVACWAEDPCNIGPVYNTLAMETLATLPHMMLQKSNAEHQIRGLKKDVNRGEAVFNKWLKQKMSGHTPQP